MLNIVIPMAGRGSRFQEAGYDLPKPLIPVHGVPMIQVVINNLRPASEHRFIFLCLEEHIARYQVDQALRAWSPGCEIVPVASVTEGAACTVLLARDLINNDDPLMIANSDQWVDINVNEYLDVLAQDEADGLILTMWSDHPKCSYIRFGTDGAACELVEKQVVSNEATVGIYNFRRGADFVRAAEKMIAKNLRVNNEFYVAPVYNELLGPGYRLAYHNVGREYDGVYGIGIPEDLARFEQYTVSGKAVRLPGVPPVAAERLISPMPASDLATPVFSLVVPVFNGEKYLDGCLDSIAAAVTNLSAADRDLVEVIVCDNRSTDRSREIADKRTLPCGYQVIGTPEHYENRTRNWHHGLSAARGEWIMMLHADDLMAPGGIAAILEAARRDASASAVMISGRHRTFSDEAGGGPSAPKPRWPLPALISGDALRARVLPYLCCFVPFTVMRRNAYEKIGGLDARYEMVQDWDLWIRLLALGDLYYYPKDVGLWRTHGYSERWQKLFAKEHLVLSSRVGEMVPPLSVQATESALDAQLAKARHWLPDVALELLVDDAEPSAGARVSDRPQPSGAHARQTLRRVERRVSANLYWLRFVGGLQLLRPRTGAGAAAKKAGSAAAASNNPS